jgi:hypothetical protein
VKSFKLVFGFYCCMKVKFDWKQVCNNIEILNFLKKGVKFLGSEKTCSQKPNLWLKFSLTFRLLIWNSFCKKILIDYLPSGMQKYGWFFLLLFPQIVFVSNCQSSAKGSNCLQGPNNKKWQFKWNCASSILFSLAFLHFAHISPCTHCCLHF